MVAENTKFLGYSAWFWDKRYTLNIRGCGGTGGSLCEAGGTRNVYALIFFLSLPLDYSRTPVPPIEFLP